VPGPWGATHILSVDRMDRDDGDIGYTITVNPGDAVLDLSHKAVHTI